MTKNEQEVKVAMIAGLLAGSFTKFLTHPLDTIKAKMQVNYQKGVTLHIKDVLRNVLINEGVKGLYKGVPISVIGSLPATLLYFGSYEFAKKNLLNSKIMKYNFLNYFVSGMFAELISCIIFVPVDIIKERRQVQSNLKTYNYSSDYDAIKQVIKNEGIRGIYKAYGATLLSFGPFTAIHWSIFEHLKGFFVENHAEAYFKRINKQVDYRQKTELTFYESMLCNAIAGAISSVITNPLDLVKMRMQVQRADKSYKEGEALYKNIFQGIGVVVRNEGIHGLFKGSLARAIYVVPMATIITSIVEVLKPEIRKKL